MRLSMAAIVSALFVGGASGAAAEEFTGGALQTACREPPTSEEYLFKQTRCMAYIDGVIDTASLIRAAEDRRLGRPSDPIFCLTPTSTREVVRDAVLLHLSEHPDQLDMPAAVPVMAALKRYLPCR